MGILFLNARRKVRHLPKGESGLSLLFKLWRRQERHKYESPESPTDYKAMPPLWGREIRRFTKENSYEGKPCRCAFSLGKASSKAATNNQHKRQTRVVRMECPYDCRHPWHTGVKNLTYSAYSYCDNAECAALQSGAIESGVFLQESVSVKNLTLCTGGQRCWVRIPPGPTWGRQFKWLEQWRPFISSSSSIGRAPSFQVGCCEFKPRLLVHMAVSYNSSTKVFDTFGGGA